MILIIISRIINISMINTDIGNKTFITNDFYYLHLSLSYFYLLLKLECNMTTCFKKSIISFVSMALFLSACSDKVASTTINTQDSIEVTINNFDELDAEFKRLHYTDQDWQNSIKEIPRLTFQGVSPEWQKTSHNMPVENKKSIFLRLMLPSILLSNENILREREVVKSAELTDKNIIDIAVKYRVIKSDTEVLTNEHQQTLLNRVNIIPPSLALAQAAEESGWGTSRFAKEGNAFFGQWDFSGNGIAPKQQRKELGNYGIARFDSPFASVEGYMLNINTTAAYQSLRDLRAKQVASKQAFSGTLLAGTLIKYSERGEAYITGLRHLISYNKLQFTDDTFLSDKPLVHLVR